MARQAPNANFDSSSWGVAVWKLLTGPDMNSLSPFWVALVCLALACGPKSNPAVVDGGLVDSGIEADAGPVDAGPVDSGVPDAGVIDGGVACDRADPCTIGWTEPDRFPVVIDHHASFVHEDDAGASFYVLGGARSAQSDVKEIYGAVRRARITSTGSLGAWGDAGVLPAAIGFAAQVVSGDRVYLCGGVGMAATGLFASGKVLVGKISPNDGEISWQLGPQLTEGVLHGTAVVLENKLYLIGGSAQFPKDKVFVSQLDADGLPGPWAAGPALPQPRSHHTAVIHGGRIFLAGGFTTGEVGLTPVLRSEHDAAGTITGWTVVGDMPNPPWTAGASVWGDSLFVVGGGQGGPGAEMFTDRVRQARFLSDNTLSPFADVTPLPIARSHVHQAPIYKGKIYSVGGRLMPSGSSIDRVFVGAFQ